MSKTMMLTLAILLASALPFASASTCAENQADKTTAIDNLPFCALVLRVFVYEHGARTRTYILMEPDGVTETNLRLLFEKVGQMHASTLSLEVVIYTDVEQLGFLATRQTHSGLPNFKRNEARSAYYRRDQQVELFRYNPNYPDTGLKTVIIRGKE